jgi:hypothetical protein
MFWGRQTLSRREVQRRKAISNTLNMGKESAPETMKKLYALTPLSARGHFIGSHSKISETRSLNLVSHHTSKYLVN